MATYTLVYSHDCARFSEILSVESLHSLGGLFWLLVSYRHIQRFSNLVTLLMFLWLSFVCLFVCLFV